MKRALLLALATSLCSTGAALGGDADDSRFALHRTTWDGEVDPCNHQTNNPNLANIPCDQYTTTAPVGDYSLVYVVVGHGPAVGIQGVSFGIDYNGRVGQMNGIAPEYLRYYRCFDGLDFPNSGGFGDFPAPKGGVRMTWVTCQQNNIGGMGTHAVACALACYAYAPDQLSITPNNNLSAPPELTVVTCDDPPTETDLLDVFPSWAWYSLMGRVEFGGGSGFTPCGVVPAEASTWGKIKAHYGAK